MHVYRRSEGFKSSHFLKITGPPANFIKEITAALGRPVVPEVYKSISICNSFDPARNESEGRVFFRFAISWSDTLSAQLNFPSSPSSIKQIDRIFALIRSSLIV